MIVFAKFTGRTVNDRELFLYKPHTVLSLALGTGLFFALVLLLVLLLPTVLVFLGRLFRNFVGLLQVVGFLCNFVEHFVQMLALLLEVGSLVVEDEACASTLLQVSLV